MKLTKSKLKQIIKEELENIKEVEYDEEGSPLYIDPKEDVPTPDDAEVLVPGYGGMRIDQIKNRVVIELKDMAEVAASGEFRRIGREQLRIIILFLETLDKHKAI